MAVTARSAADQVLLRVRVIAEAPLIDDAAERVTRLGARSREDAAAVADDADARRSRRSARALRPGLSDEPRVTLRAVAPAARDGNGGRTANRNEEEDAASPGQ